MAATAMQGVALASPAVLQEVKSRFVRSTAAAPAQAVDAENAPRTTSDVPKPSSAQTNSGTAVVDVTDAPVSVSLKVVPGSIRTFAEFVSDRTQDVLYTIPPGYSKISRGDVSYVQAIQG